MLSKARLGHAPDPPASARITRHTLLEAVWSKPMIEIAADHDTSAYYIVSLCKRWGCRCRRTTTGSGSWSGAAATRRPTLPQPSSTRVTVLSGAPRPHVLNRKE